MTPGPGLGAVRPLRSIGVVLLLAPAAIAVCIAMVSLLRLAVSIDFNSRADADLILWLCELAAGITAALAGAWLVHRSSTSATGWMLQLASVALAVSALATTAATKPGTWLPFGDQTTSVHLWANLLGRALLLVAAGVSLPDRVIAGRVGGGLGTALAAALTVALTAGLLVRHEVEALRNTPLGFGNRAWVEAAANVPAWVFFVLLAIHVCALLLLSHQRGGEPTLFQVVGWGLAAAALPAAFPSIAARLPQEAAEVLAAISLPTLPLISVVAVLRALSWTMSRFVSRTIVWGLLSAGVLGVQALAVSVAALSGARLGLVTAVAASVAVAVGLQAARARLQRTVDRMLFGAGRDPWAALGDLGRRMQLALGPDEVLPELARTVADAFAAGVTVELATPAGMIEAARAGASGDGGRVHSWPLVHQGERVGTLTVRPPAGAPFRPADLRALDNLAHQAAVAADGVRASLELRRSQAELVVAVEDERRRLQRELHDGLGPTLAGVALGIRAARNQLADESASADDLLARLTREVESSVEDVRRIVHDLRPAALDQLGLVTAIRSYADRCSTEDLRVHVETPGALPILSAATEVAAYRIAIEAITNVVRHAQARRCTVRLRHEDGLIIEVEDDGVGMGAEVTAGVGLTSMRERSAALGGRLLVGVGPDGGTRVVSALPIVRHGA